MQSFRALNLKNKIIVGVSALIVTCCGCLGLIAILPGGDDGDAAEVAVRTTAIIDIAALPEETAVPTEPAATDEPEPTETAVPTDTKEPEPTVTNTKLPTATPKPQLKITSSTANLRSGPGTSYNTSGVLNAQDVVTILARNNDGSWYNVRLADGTVGWLAASVAEPVNTAAMDAVAVAVTIPALPLPSNTPAPTSPPATATNPPLPTEPPPPVEAPPPTSQPAPGGCAICSYDAYNCSSFSTQFQAQSCFEYCRSSGAGDIHRLDRDNDGRVCESLP